MNVTLLKIGRMVVASGWPSPSESFVTGGLEAVERIPEGYRPADEGAMLFVSNNGGSVMSWLVDSDGKITVRGRADKNYISTCLGSWVTE